MAVASICCWHLFGVLTAQGVLVGIEYYDRANVNPEFSGGPLWSGFVDTKMNTLTIQSWTELPLHGSEYWVPRNQPVIWAARDAAGNVYDVPDTFDGHIDDSWGFVSSRSLQEMEWYRPVLNNTTSPPTLDFVEAEFDLDTGQVWPGWGAFALERNIGGQTVKVFETKNPSNLSGQPLFDEHIMPALPVQPEINGQLGDLAWVASTGAEVTTTLLDTSSVLLPGDFNGDLKVDGKDFLMWQRNPGLGSLYDQQTNFGVVAVPEARQWIVLALLAGALTLWNASGIWKTRRHREAHCRNN